MIVARKANVAVIFRRGPSQWTRVIKWNTADDTFELGHWFRGRIYERRCDLSPDGTKLLYFVSKINQRTLKDKEYTHAWTAISKLPWLTALALWPKGNCWHGGGLFESNDKVFLNHKPERAQPHPNHQPKDLTVIPNPDAYGEDEPVYSMRLTRDGWKVVKEWEFRYHYPRRGGYITDQPEVRERHHPQKAVILVLKRSISGFEYREEFEIVNLETGTNIPLENVGFADWDHNGRLALLNDGKLKIGQLNANDELEIEELADFNSQKLEQIESPDWARHW